MGLAIPSLRAICRWRVLPSILRLASGADARPPCRNMSKDVSVENREEASIMFHHAGRCGPLGLR